MAYSKEAVALRKQHKKRCMCCNEVKDLSEFDKNGNTTHYKSYCRPCHKARRSLDNKVNHTAARQRVTRTYGVSREEYDRLTAGSCEICGRHVDGKMCLDHTTAGSYHGVLCLTCNSAIGGLHHDPEVIRKALEYVKRTR